MSSPLLLGLHNPLSDDPKRALYPDPPGSAGDRLWAMSGMDKEDWLFSFNRMNLMNGKIWIRSAAEENLPDVISAMVRASVTLVLGHQVRKFLELPEVPWILPQETELFPPGPRVRWRLLPHPSGRTQTYNDPVFRAAVRLLLQELVK